MKRRYMPAGPAVYLNGEWRCACNECARRPQYVLARMVTVTED